MQPRNSSTVLFRSAFVFCVLLLLACGCKVTRVRQAEVAQRIRNDIPIGSQKDQVLAFLDSFEIGGLKAEHHGYIPEVAPGPIVWEGPAIVIGGHINATIPNAARDDTRLQVYRINMDFQFDSQERLTDYKVQTQGDW
jgi:hypothetical protein